MRVAAAGPLAALDHPHIVRILDHGELTVALSAEVPAGSAPEAVTVVVPRSENVPSAASSATVSQGTPASDAEPPAAEPPAVEPPAAEPPAVDPPAVDPPAAEPPAAEPPAAEPPAAEPPAADTVHSFSWHDVAPEHTEHAAPLMPQAPFTSPVAHAPPGRQHPLAQLCGVQGCSIG